MSPQRTTNPWGNFTRINLSLIFQTSLFHGAAVVHSPVILNPTYPCYYNACAVTLSDSRCNTTGYDTVPSTVQLLQMMGVVWGL